MRLNPAKPLGKGCLPTKILRSADAADGAEASGRLADFEVVYKTGNHTNELVTVHARGPANIGDLFAPHEGTFNAGTTLTDNTHLFWVMSEFLGIQPGYSPLRLRQ